MIGRGTPRVPAPPVTILLALLALAQHVPLARAETCGCMDLIKCRIHQGESTLNDLACALACSGDECDDFRHYVMWVCGVLALLWLLRCLGKFCCELLTEELPRCCSDLKSLCENCCESLKSLCEICCKSCGGCVKCCCKRMDDWNTERKRKAAENELSRQLLAKEVRDLEQQQIELREKELDLRMQEIELARQTDSAKLANTVVVDTVSASSAQSSVAAVPEGTLAEFYAVCKLEKFAATFEELGVAEVSDFVDITDAELIEAGLKALQIKRIRRQVPTVNVARNQSMVGGLSRPASPQRLVAMEGAKGMMGASRPASPSRGGLVGSE